MLKVLDAIRLCQSLKIPVISVNAGADLSQELGLLQHVGQMEYTAGYGAALRLADEGIREAYCLNHQVGNIVLDERCRCVHFDPVCVRSQEIWGSNSFPAEALATHLLQSTLA